MASIDNSSTVTVQQAISECCSATASIVINFDYDAQQMTMIMMKTRITRMTTMTKKKSNNYLLQRPNNEMQAALLVQRIVNINNGDSSGNDDDRYKQRINSGNVGGKNYNGEIDCAMVRLGQWQHSGSGVGISNSCCVMTEWQLRFYISQPAVICGQKVAASIQLLLCSITAKHRKDDFGGNNRQY